MIMIIPPERVEAWRRQDRIDKAFDLAARVIVRLVWWSVLIGAGYITALIVVAGQGGAA